ncbi:ABC transporter substrate-binding protein [Sanguibacter antarcticus]|uniref:Carbohydrate ABC transporter substrate-binding protein (CUT1 family) n=1 Tax=Sanguibacter antarcticus TaxID=372484 RepID=A0A2A9E355_9MICO|nr:ABC transporter substrate-binding protein [Sanguibacter antarcticus]PFG32630.1 carbohydrate ABC transporter substrate-binding protein (CUT1 family) [Sanguibacter antarcticus]
MFPHSRRTRAAALTALASVIGLTAACSSSSGESNDDGVMAGEITVLTWRTDLLEDGTLDGYKAAFEKKYPDVTVEFEGITDYEGEVRTRMNTDDYGDVLGIPGTITPEQLPDFFEPLGTTEELAQTYRFINDKSFDGNGYGIAVVGNAQGLVYNKAVWEAAGITELPTTPEEFIADLAAIADSTDAVPLYTNYAASWPVTQWDGHRGSITCDEEFNRELPQDDAPWSEGKDLYVIDSVLWDAAEGGFIEDDPTTTDWEASKGMLGTGEIATMALGSWAIGQMQEAAEDPADIGYMPFPNQVGGTFCSSIGGDYNQAINIHSDHKEEARAWIDWFNSESGYAESQGGLSPLLEGDMPTTLADFAALGDDLVYLEQLPAEPGKETLVTDIDNTAEIGLQKEIYRKALIDAARGQTDETKDEFFADLNTRWAEARASVVS